MVLAQSLLKALDAEAGTAIDVLAPAWSHPLLARMPEVSGAIEAPLRRGRLQLRHRYRLGKQLADRGYAQSIILPNSWKSALIPYWSRIPRRTGYIGEQRWGLLNDVRKLNKAHLPMTVQRFVALAGDDTRSGVDVDNLYPELVSTRDDRAAAAQALGLTVDRTPVLVLCAGAEYGPSKCWPTDYYARVAQAKLKQNWRVWLVGSANDSESAREINQLCDDRCVDLTGRTGLGQAIDLLAMATIVVSNDSGLMHIAAAVRRPVVALFGSTDPAHTPPLSRECEILYEGLSCSPCFKRECPLKHLNCLRQLSPDRVLAAIDTMTESST